MALSGAERQRAYRARQKAASVLKVAKGATPHGGGTIERAQAQAEAARKARAEVLRKLPHVMGIDDDTPASKAARIRPKMETERTLGPAVKTKAAQAARARAIRENAAAQRVSVIGKQKRDTLRVALTDGPHSEILQGMTDADRDRFDKLSERIASLPAQALGILFKHAGGQDLYTDAYEQILYEPTRESGFAVLESLAGYADRARDLYSPKALRELGLGDKRGYLNI